MELVNQTREGLIAYTCAQVAAFCPDGGFEDFHRIISRHVDEALCRLERCINVVRMWPPKKFNYLHSSQYCQYLYFLANTIWRNEKDPIVCAKLFLINKALNGIDLFYEIEMPDFFFIGHSVGIVLAKATYANYLVLYQNSTIGKNRGVAPILEEGVVLYPAAAIIGRSTVRSCTVLSQGVGLVNRDTPGDCLVFYGPSNEYVFKPGGMQIVNEIFAI